MILTTYKRCDVAPSVPWAAKWLRRLAGDGRFQERIERREATASPPHSRIRALLHLDGFCSATAKRFHLGATQSPRLVPDPASVFGHQKTQEDFRPCQSGQVSRLPSFGVLGKQRLGRQPSENFEEHPVQPVVSRRAQIFARRIPAPPLPIVPLGKHRFQPCNTFGK